MSSNSTIAGHPAIVTESCTTCYRQVITKVDPPTLEQLAFNKDYGSSKISRRKAGARRLAHTIAHEEIDNLLNPMRSERREKAFAPYEEPINSGIEKKPLIGQKHLVLEDQT